MLVFVMAFLVYPVVAQNNKFGISLLQPSAEDVREAAELVNGNGGAWGYVTLVIQENDRDTHKWQDLFEQLRVHKLIPIVRIATSPQGEVWRRPEKKDIQEWVTFLNKLNWVVKKRYVVLFNEPNHASEWGGEVDPAGFGEVSGLFAAQLKKTSDDYVVMLGGLDGAAPQYGTQYYDSIQFLRDMCSGDRCPELFANIDAWSSHSYPNPAFSGSVWDTGKKSIRGYETELATLRDLGIQKQLPVFITETGWNTDKVSDVQTGNNMETAYRDIWLKDERVQAVTPFVFKYLSPPFLGFSWKHESEDTQQLITVRSMQKEKGAPEQHEGGNIQLHIPNKLLVESTYHMTFRIKNTGQAIWDADDNYAYAIEYVGKRPFTALLPEIRQIKPFEEEQVDLYVKTSSETDVFQVRLLLQKNGKTILGSSVQRGILEPLPSLQASVMLFPKLISNGDDFEVQIFNQREEIVFRKKGLPVRKGVLKVEHVSNVIPDEQYRVVVLGYPYIPRQEIVTFKKGMNVVKIKRMFPFDADGNGTWDLNDVKAALMQPSFLLRFVPWNQL